MALSGVPLGQWSGSDATNALHETIKQFNEQSSRQTDQMLKLTRVMAWLTVAMFIGLIVQIAMAWK